MRITWRHRHDHVIFPLQDRTTMTTTIHVRRPLQINLHALLQQQAPTIDLGVESYENSTRNFLEAVAKYKNRSMTAIAERRRHEAHEKKKMMDKTAAVEAETGRCKLKEIELVARMFFFILFTCPDRFLLHVVNRARTGKRREEGCRAISCRVQTSARISEG